MNKILSAFVIVILAGCVSNPINPNMARLKITYTSGAAASSSGPVNRQRWSAKIISVVSKDTGKKYTVNHGIFASKYMELPPGNYRISHGCVPFGHTDAIQYALNNATQFKFDEITLESGKTYMPKNKVGIAVVGMVCNTQMVVLKN